MPTELEFRATAKPDHGLIQVYDSDAYLPDSVAAERCRATVVASSGRQLYLHSLQGTAPAEIIIRVWEGPAPTPEAGWEPEGQAAAVLDSPTGLLVIRAFVPEIAGEIDLPRPGIYAAHVSWRGREAAAEQEARLMRRLPEPDSQELDAVFAAHSDVLETYRIDLWWQFESESDAEDDWN
ncbi:hypothetical protein [Kitasatospora sp. HPMI-4]|uniref:hypothetical protein n=1 Tax=Kitasatospora sp. HPMI-4 TaxID=3448443 RepID=UPI003F19A5F8